MLAVATVGGVGLVPVAPGTAASALVVPLVPSLAAMAAHAPATLALIVALTIVVAVWSAARAERVLGRHDDGSVVVDEVAGMVVGAVWVPPTWLAAFVLFLAFRFFDIVKPPPIAFLDRRIGGGTGVVVDDLVAGLYAGALTWLVLRLT